MKCGEKGVISRGMTLGSQISFLNRVQELGLLPGTEVEVLHEAPWSKDPIAIRARGGILAIRRQDADGIEVEIQEKTE